MRANARACVRVSVCAGTSGGAWDNGEGEARGAGPPSRRVTRGVMRPFAPTLPLACEGWGAEEAEGARLRPGATGGRVEASW